MKIVIALGIIAGSVWCWVAIHEAYYMRKWRR